MNKKIRHFLISLSLLVSTTVYAVNVPSGMIRFCEQVSRISNILASYTYIQWPVVGVPGITAGLSSRTSVILELCDYVQQLQQLETADAIFLTGQVLNQMTDNRWEHHLNFAESTWSLAQNAYDFENGEFRKGALESEAFHQEMNAYMNDSYYWYNKTFNGQEKTLKDRAQRESDMREIANTSYERATLEEALDCPDSSEASNVNYGQVYDSKIRPKIEPMEEAKEEAEFYFSQLLLMGPYFMNNEADHKKYVFRVEAMFYNGVTYNVQTRRRQDSTTKFTANKNQGQAGAEAEPKTQQVERQYQVFSPKVQQNLFQTFRQEYEGKWSSYVSQRVVSKGFDDLLDDPRQHIQEEFIDLDYECAQFKLMRGIDSSRGDYDQLFLQRRRQCEQRIILNEQKIANLLIYYTNRLQITLQQWKSQQYEIYNIRSREMGETIVMTASGDKGDIRKEKVSCVSGNKMSASTMMKLNAKINSNNAKINEQLAADTKKLLIAQENERKEKIEVAREAAIREEFSERRSRQLQEASSTSAISSPMGQSAASPEKQ
jgi:hypothetical protein